MPGHQWEVSWDNSRAGYWTCSVCNKSGFFMGIPDPMNGVPGHVSKYVDEHYHDVKDFTCKELVLIAVQTS